ncbi:MAG: hypothetical protein IJK51_02375 [Bacteroidaceae bacterium]|nr:hypothetical protein [Bacteroidaceae bacterium]
MNNNKLFRQALQRQNDQAAGMKMPDDMEQRVMKSIKPQATKRRWLYPLSTIAVAASVLLLILLNIEKQKSEQQTPVIAEVVTEPQPIIPDEPVEHANPTKPIIPVKVAKTAAPKKQLAEAELPDTLGQGIFESEENVRLAVQMLSECEATIRREEQQVNNRIIKATFNALPQAENALLVTNENGDFEVIEVSEQTAIEI